MSRSIPFLIALCLLLSPVIVFAQGGGIGITPSQIEGEDSRSWFVYTMNKNEVKEDIIVINNHSIRTKTIVVESLDAISTADGSYSLVNSASDNQDVGNWVSIENPEIILPAGGSAEVKFSVTVPSDANVGEHNGGITVYEKQPQNIDGVNVVTRVAARMYITVPGLIERDVELTSITHEIKDGKLFINIKGVNKSNIKLEPALDIRVSGLLGSRLLEANQNGTFLAGQVMDITKEWERPAPKFGYYRVNVVLHTWDIEQTMPDGSVSELPNLDFSINYGFWVGSIYLLWLIIILILFWIAFRTIVYFGDRSKYVLDVETYIAKKGDTIMHISERTGIFPRMIVKLNHLKWPHVINTKDKILIPRGRLSADKLYQKRISSPMPSIWRYLVTFQISLYHPSVQKSKK